MTLNVILQVEQHLDPSVNLAQVMLTRHLLWKSMANVNGLFCKISSLCSAGERHSDTGLEQPEGE